METSGLLDRTRLERDRTREQTDARPRDLGEVYDAYAGPLFRYLVALLRVEQDAEDAMQDLFVALGRADLSRIRDLRAYLFQAARRHALATLRARRRQERETAAAEFSWIDLDAGLGEDRALALDLDRALQKLPSEQREVVMLHLCEGFSFREIATVCGVSHNTAAIRAAQVALTLEVYGAEHSAYPATLAALEQAGWKLPRDPFGGGEYRYRPEGAGFVVWSIGLDMQDDNASREFADLSPEAKRQANQYDYDIIFRVGR